MEACQHYYSDNPGQCAYYSPNCGSATNRYTTIATNCPNCGCACEGNTVCDRTWEVAHINARDWHSWIYQTDGFIGWYVGYAFNQYGGGATDWY